MTQTLQNGDTELITASRKGDKEAFGKLIRKYISLVHAKAILLTRDPHEAEDLVQETFFRAFRRLRSLKEDAAFGPWLLTINRNLAFSRYRKTKREKEKSVPLQEEFLPGVEDDQDDIFKGPDAGKVRTRILNAIDNLPEHYRLPILLHYMEGLSYRDIQDKLQISAGTLKGIISRGVVKLRGSLKQLKVIVD